MSFLRRLRSEGVRSLAAVCVLAAGMVLFGRIVDEHYPFKHWLFFRYLAAWSLTALYCVSCFVGGLRLFDLVLRAPVRLFERFVFAFSLGVLAFFCGTFLAGILGLLGKVFFYALPLSLLAFGAKHCVAEAKRLMPALRPFGVRLFVPQRPIEIAAALFLIVSLIAVYLQVMLPQNVNADSYWYHLPVAEHYVARGAIRRFEEGWYLGAYPQLPSLLYTWAFLAPGSFFDHMVLSSHLDFALFAATLPGVSVLTARLVRSRRVRFASAAMFLFPGLFLYDSNVNGGADHILAFWAPPVAVALIRFGRNFSTREGVLSGLMLAAAASTKYQASYFFAPAVLLVLGLAAKNRRIYPALAAGLSCGVVTASHWLKNLIFYRDPLYPLLYKHFPSTPFHKGAAQLLENVFWYAYFTPQGTRYEKWKAALSTLATFSFVPNDWEPFHGTRPVFGSLFTLLIPVLLFLRASRRIWLLIVGTHLGMIVWYMTSHQDRYLQALVPWMAATTAAALWLLWKRGAWVRIPTALLVGLQVISGSDVYFIRQHAMLGDSPFRALGEYLGDGHKKSYARRYLFPGTYEKNIAPKLPKGAKVLIHIKMSKLGLGAQSVADGPGWQGAIEYLDHDSPQNTVELWRRLGVTHLMWEFDRGSTPPTDLAREAVFLRAVHTHARQPRRISSWRLSQLPSAGDGEPDARDPTRILWLACRENAPPGLYTPSGVDRKKAIELIDMHDPAALASGLRRANVVMRRKCSDAVTAVLDPALEDQFVDMGRGGDAAFWVRQKGRIPEAHLVSASETLKAQ